MNDDTQICCFANALSGVLYDNNNYLRQCRYALHLETANRLKHRNRSNAHFFEKQRPYWSRLQRDSKSNSMQKSEYNNQTAILTNTALNLQE
jgi:hypothetical protein